MLEAVAAQGGFSGLADIASRTGMDRSTTYRMLTTLVSAGYVRQEAATRRYALTYRVVSLSRNLLADDEITGSRDACSSGCHARPGRRAT